MHLLLGLSSVNFGKHLLQRIRRELKKKKKKNERTLMFPSSHPASSSAAQQTDTLIERCICEILN